MLVDEHLGRSKSDADTKVILERNVELPEYMFPFAVFTTDDCMLLWASTIEEKFKWANGFKALISESD